MVGASIKLATKTMPKLLSCPHCGYTRSWVIRRYHRKCKKCRREFSPPTRFPVNGYRLGADEWRETISAFLEYGTIVRVARAVRRSYATMQKAVALIRRVMTDDVPFLFSGTAEADETYVGGSWKNKAVHIRRQGSKRGRRTSKQAVFGIASRDAKQVRVWLVTDAKRRTLIPLIERQVVRGSAIYTDGHKPYRSLPRKGYRHEWVDHAAGEYVRGDVHTQTIDGYWGLLKTHLDSIGGIRKRSLPYYIGEHVWRYNSRRLSLHEQVECILMLLKRFGGKN